MLGFRLLLVFVLLGAGVCVAAYLWSGERRWLLYAKRILRLALGIVLIYLGLFALERIALLPLL